MRPRGSRSVRRSTDARPCPEHREARSIVERIPWKRLSKPAACLQARNSAPRRTLDCFAVADTYSA